MTVKEETTLDLELGMFRSQPRVGNGGRGFLAFREPSGEERDQVVIECAFSRQGDRPPLGRASQRLNRFDVGVREQVAVAERRQQVGLLEVRKIVEEWSARVAVAEPDAA